MLFQNFIEIGDELFWEPNRLVFPGPWAGHIPFAFWLVKTLRPKLVVELGTHSGNSYSALCQAMHAYNVDGLAYAVDTWEGDEHAGEYEINIYQDLYDFNKQYYSSFSTLLKMYFDEAREYFKEKSIDLLHIDGMHTYDAVKHDFDNWKNTLTDRGIVLFHDTGVRERNFGVWQLWSELSQIYPSFEFHHSNGLGVLGVGGALPTSLKALFESSKEEAAEIRRLFAQSGKLFTARTDMLAVSREGETYLQTITELNNSIAEMRNASQDSQSNIGDLKKENARLNTKIFQQSQQIEQLKVKNINIHNMYQNSTSWRITWPIRFTVSLVKRLFTADGRAHIRSSLAVRTKDVFNLFVPHYRRFFKIDHLIFARAKKVYKKHLNKQLTDFLISNQRLTIPRSDNPDVSIIIIVYNQTDLLYACLKSISASLAASDLNIETIIWDNSSEHKTHQFLDLVDGCIYTKSEENLHFLRGVNHSVDKARGRYLLFLNSDAQLTSGSLEHAVALLKSDPSIGAIGGRLILPDGKLQEAGSIIWNDGTCVAYGVGKEIESPEVMFRRDVDYCSGAFLVTPRELFLKMNKFDEQYIPAYYEETDYCVRLWKNGHRVVYDPAIVTHHYEFGSSVKSQDAIDLQKKNHKVFTKIHADWLATKYPPSEFAKLSARYGGSSKQRVLFIDDRVPHVELGAGFPRANSIIKELLSLNVHLTLFPMCHNIENWTNIWRSVSEDVEVMFGSDASKLSSFLEERHDIYDVIIISRPHNMRIISEMLIEKPDIFGHAHVIYDAEAIFARREDLARKIGQNSINIEDVSNQLNEEINLSCWADSIIVVSEEEKKIFEDKIDKPLYLLGHTLQPNITNTPFEDRTDIVFVGPAYDDDTPNADSLRWFVKEVLPKIRETLGINIRLKVIGTVTAPTICALDEMDIDLLGQVSDLKPFMESARLIVIPTRFAAGIPHKAHHAASYGVPIVSTQLICNQLGWMNGEDILASDDSILFSEHCCNLYTNNKLWQRLRLKAFRKVTFECNRELFRKTVASLLNKKENSEKLQFLSDMSNNRYLYRDNALAIPLLYDFINPCTQHKVAAIIHIFYENMASSILAYVNKIPGEVDLFISTDTPEKAQKIEKIFAVWNKGNIEIRIFPNRGRDIAPKIIGYRDVYERYELVLHLHSKASLHDSQLNSWREFLMDHLVGSEIVVQSIFEIFNADTRVGIIAPYHFEYVRGNINWGVNYKNGFDLASRLGMNIKINEPLDFPSGSMFWARSAALKPLLDLNLAFDDFDEEAGQQDGTLAHAIERIYFLCCEVAGYKAIKVALPERFKDISHISIVDNKSELERWLVISPENKWVQN